MFRLLGLTNVTLLLATTLAATQPACLPKSVFSQNKDGELPIMDLGYANNVLTLCAYQKASFNDEPGGPDKHLGCWTVDPTTGALGVSTVTAIPGRGRRVVLDAKNCIDGYCVPPIKTDRPRPFFAASTDGAHAAILSEGSDDGLGVIYIFETGTKKKITEIPVYKPDAPEGTNVGNAPWGLLYNGDTLFVIGSDAGPAIYATVFKENGDRAGAVLDGDTALNLFKGGFGILGRDKVVIADAGLQNMTTVTGANVETQSSKRAVSYAPCKKSQFEDDWLLGDDSQTGACKRTLDAKYNLYKNMSPALLPSGDIVSTLSGPAQGNLVVLNESRLTEVRRVKLARCR